MSFIYEAGLLSGSRIEGNYLLSGIGAVNCARQTNWTLSVPCWLPDYLYDASNQHMGITSSLPMGFQCTPSNEYNMTNSVLCRTDVGLGRSQYRAP